MYAPVAQLDRVTGYEPVGRGFESLLAHHSSGCPQFALRFIYMGRRALLCRAVVLYLAIQAYNLRLQMPDFMGFVGLLFFYSRRTRTRYPFLRFTICAITFPLSVFLSCIVIQNNFYFFPKYILQFLAFSAD